jgi:hypothetical protein
MNQDVLNTLYFEQAEARTVDLLNQYSGKLTPLIEKTIKNEVSSRYPTLTAGEINRVYGRAVRKFGETVCQH